MDVIHAVEGVHAFDLCVLGLESCDAAKPCPLHRTWLSVKEGLMVQLEKHSLCDLANSIRNAEEPNTTQKD
ncbi:MAG: hypothetical protein AMXMBFR84_17010 [Candidatus Hydrogenedentota bacterium]